MKNILTLKALRNMPFYKHNTNGLPRSRRLEKSTEKNGLRQAIFSTSGNKYTGEWKNNLKDGKGAHFSSKTGELYQGDYENNLRHGFGVLAKYCSKTHSFKLLYRGTYINGKQDGYGMRIYYKERKCYLGNFAFGKRNGYGNMWYEDGTFYNGNWVDGMRHGEGLLFSPNGNRFEGYWERDNKHGRGTYYFLNSGQVQEGIWKNDVPSVTTISDIPYRQTCCKPTLFPIPKICLVNPDEILKFQEGKVLLNAAEACRPGSQIENINTHFSSSGLVFE